MHDVRRADEDAAARFQEKREILHRSLRLTQMLDDVAQDDVIELLMPRRAVERFHVKRFNNGEMARKRRRLRIELDAVKPRFRILVANGEECRPTGAADFEYGK